MKSRAVKKLEEAERLLAKAAHPDTGHFTWGRIPQAERATIKAWGLVSEAIDALSVSLLDSEQRRKRR
jgi:hypothetical protein